MQKKQPRINAVLDAIGNNEIDVLKEYLKDDSKKKIVSNEKIIEFALRHRCIDALSALIDAGCNIDKETDDPALSEFGKTLLMRAIQTENRDAVKLLLEKGADVNKVCFDKDIDGEQVTALMLASKNGQLDIVTMLANANAELDFFGKTNVIELTEYQKNLMMSVSHKTPEQFNLHIMLGKNALMSAAIGKRPIETVNLLLELGANVHAKNDYGYDVIDFLIKRRDSHGVISLIQSWLEKKTLDRGIGDGCLSGDPQRIIF